MSYSFVLLALLFSATLAQNCVFNSEDGSKYDLSPLEGNAPYTFSDHLQNTYYVDFCHDTKAGCSGNAAVCLLTRDGQHLNLGSPDRILFSELPHKSGIELTYASTETCANGRTRKTTILMNCSPERLAVDFVKKPDDCYTIVSMFSQYGCPNMNITEDESEFCAQFNTKDDCFRYSSCECGWCDEQCVSSKFQDHCESYEFECHARRLTAGMVFLMTLSVLTLMLFGFACCLCCCYKSRRAAHYKHVTSQENVEEAPVPAAPVQNNEDEDLKQAIELSKLDNQPAEETPLDPTQQPMFVYQPLMPQFVSPLQYAQYAHFQFMNSNQQPVQYPFFFQPQVQMPQSETQDQ